MELIVIAAISENNVIGINGKLPWHFSEDLKRFRRLTLNFPIIMGRKTFESIGKPLDKRTNIVLTKNSGFKRDGIVVCNSVSVALSNCKGFEKAFVIGGESLYKEIVPLAQKMELTFVKKKVLGDAFFPIIDFSEWIEIKRESFKDFDFVSFKRKN